MTPGPMELVALLVLAGVFLALMDLIIRRSLVGIGLMLVAAAIHAILGFLPRLGAAGAYVYVWDLFAILLGGAAVARLLRARDASLPQWLLIAFMVALVPSYVQGLMAHGLNPAMEVRSYVYFVTIALYVSTVQPERALLDRVGRAWVLFAGVLLLLALARWAALPFGIQGAGGWLQGTSVAIRVLQSHPTLVLLQAFLICGIVWIRGGTPTWVRRLAPAMLAAVVLLQHRTVWAALLVVVAFAFLMERGAARKLLPLMGLGLVLLAAVSMAVLDQGTAELTEDLGDAAADRRTWEWRVEGWKSLLTQDELREPATFLFGRPFGSGWERVVGGRVQTVSPHNYYVQTFGRTGIVGLGLLLALYATVLWRLARRRDKGGLLGSRTLFLMLLAQPIYFIAYTPGSEQGIVLGLAIAVAFGIDRSVAKPEAVELQAS